MGHAHVGGPPRAWHPFARAPMSFMPSRV
jgi:hypothetical protein